ncbi:MAG TPA: STAS domain-containing protein [Acidimicrobiia bacterium]|nr:STAS domain-containing protein [Acidimicrobiia bacterium]
MHEGGRPLQVVVTVTGEESARVQPTGDLDATTSSLFAAVLSDTYFQGCTAITVDLAEVSACDEAGVDVIVGALAYVETCGKVIEFVAAPPWLETRLRAAGLDRALARAAAPS